MPAAILGRIERASAGEDGADEMEAEVTGMEGRIGIYADDSAT